MRLVYHLIDRYSRTVMSVDFCTEDPRCLRSLHRSIAEYEKEINQSAYDQQRG